jgi:hypothetical protein
VLVVVLVELDEFEVLSTTVVELELVEEVVVLVLLAVVFVVLELSDSVSTLRPPLVVVVFVAVVFEEAFAGTG